MKKLMVILTFCFYSVTIGNVDVSYNIYEYKPPVTKATKIKAYTKSEIVKAIIRQESSDGKFLYSSAKWEKAVGVLQIRPVMLNHINKNILGYKKFTLEDRLDSLKSVQMFFIYQKKYNPTMNFEMACRLWNGGQTGMKKESTIEYYNTVKKHIKSIAMR